MRWRRLAAALAALGLAAGGCSSGGGGDEDTNQPVDTGEEGSGEGLPDTGEGSDTEGEPDTGEGAEGEPDSEEGGQDVAPDVTPDTLPDTEEEGGGIPGAFDQVKGTTVDDVLTVPGLRGVVHVVRDKDGIPHIFANNQHDGFFAQGYMHAEDRFVQMLLIRGNVGGSLAKLVGGLDPNAVRDDTFARVLGFRRVAQRTWDQMPAGPVKDCIQAYVDGINAWIADLKADKKTIAPAFGLLVNKTAVELFTPADVLTLAKYQIYNLGFDALGEISRTSNRVAAEAKFYPDAEDPQFARRAGILTDLLLFAPADRAYIVDGFDGGPWAGGPMPQAPKVPSDVAPWKAPPLGLLQQVEEALKLPQSDFALFKGPPEGASNSWVVSGALTDTGQPMLANDPHLSTNSPPLFHAVHLVVEPEPGSDEDPLNLYGLQFPGLPGILLGHNENVAWGFTTSGHDYTDAYQETLVWKEGEEWPRVLHKGQEVPLDIVEEVIEVGLSGVPTSTVTVQIPIVPHRGPLAPTFTGTALNKPKPGDTTAISLAWRGFQPSTELEAIYGWWTAKNVAEAMQAMTKWNTASQHVVFADRGGNIGYGVDGEIPVRPAAALNWHPTENPTGHAPWWVLNGTGDHDWLPAPLSRDLTPNAYNPTEGYIATANNDAVGTTDDNDPLNDYAYIGYDYDIGFRAGRIMRRLDTAAQAGKITRAEMGDIQSDAFSNLGERMRPFLLEVGQKLLAAYDDPNSDEVLAKVAAEHPDAKAQVEQALELLTEWSLVAHDGKWGEPTAEQKKDASATALFNFWAVSLLSAALDDERQHVGGVGDQLRAKAVLLMLEMPIATATYDPNTGQSAMWDNLNTPDEDETRDQIIAASLFKALAELEKKWGSSDPAAWVWGDTHFKRFTSLVPIGQGAQYAWPQAEEGHGEGFARHGDNFNVDACNGGLNDYNFGCGGIALQRLVVECNAEGIRSFNALPGGQVWNKDSEFFRNQLPTWLNNERRESSFTEDQILDDIHSHRILQP